MTVRKSIWIGRDRREETAFQVARGSLLRHLTQPIPVHALELAALKAYGLYMRPTSHKDGRMIDELSIRPDYDGSVSTEHANARFLVPYLAKSGLAMFTDGDVLFRADVARAFEGLDRSKAVHCVKHDHAPHNTTKMDGQLQTRYARKNWSSVVIFDCDHPANKGLTLELINERPGRDLHAFCWLEDDQIGSLDQSWNFLVGHTSPEVVPDIVHFTNGTPDMPGYGDVPFAPEWWRERDILLGRVRYAG